MRLKLSKSTDRATWDDALAEYIDGHVHATLEPATESNYRFILTPFAVWAESEGIGLHDFTARHMRAYISYRIDERGVKQNTARADVFRVKSWFKWLHHEGMIDRNPLADYVIPRGETPYVPTPSAAELSAMLQSVKPRYDPATNPPIRFVPKKRRRFLAARNYALFCLQIESACRIGEILSLTMADYKPSERHIIVSHSKTDKPRTVPISAAIAAVAEWLKVRPARELEKRGVDYLFVNEYGGQMDVHATLDLLQDQFKFAGLPQYTQHSLRHYSGTELAKVNLESARRILGHTSIQTTQSYLGMDAESDRAAHDLAAPLAKAIMVNKRSAANRRRRVF